MSDTLADMITRIRNGQKAQKFEISSIFSNTNMRVCEVLKKEGFIEDFSQQGDVKKSIGGLGSTILSTSKGVMTDNDARSKNLGGEILISVF